MGNRKLSKAEKKTGVLFIRNMRTHLKDAFKAYCARRGKSMTEMVEILMTKALEEESKVLLETPLSDNEKEYERKRQLQRDEAWAREMREREEAKKKNYLSGERL